MKNVSPSWRDSPPGIPSHPKRLYTLGRIDLMGKVPCRQGAMLRYFLSSLLRLAEQNASRAKDILYPLDNILPIFLFMLYFLFCFRTNWLDSLFCLHCRNTVSCNPLMMLTSCSCFSFFFFLIMDVGDATTVTFVISHFLFPKERIL